MCARISVASENVIAKLFGLEDKPVIQYNAAPTDPVAIALEEEGRLGIEVARFGLRPAWSRQPLINAKVETVREQGAFKTLFSKQRCLVPVTGFYEWETLEDGKKLPHYFVMASGEPFALAGFWSDTKEGKEMCVLTTQPNELLERIHNRMPSIVKREDFDAYLNAEAAEAQAIAAESYAADQMTSYRVSTKMSSSRYKEPDCIEAI